jgi:glyoxylase-like metal-dependent hydrolase (beta-lactamase superfamily II)
MLRTDGQLHYLRETPPQDAETVEIAPGILWLRLPLPFRLNHVNVWLLREQDGWTIVDTGAGTQQARDLWEAVLGGVLSGARINRIICTHGHTDHIGLAGWLVQRADAPFAATLVEWLSAQVRLSESQQPMRPEVVRFMAGHGCDAPTIEAYRNDRRRTHALLGEIPGAIERLRDGATIAFGGREWRILVCGGHTLEHASFWCESDNILIAGDQVLSKISPMIGVYPGEPLADPLAEYLGSLHRFRELPADALVLPSHGLPFVGLHTRLDQLQHHHELRLDHLARLMDGPRTTMELTHGLFPKAVAQGQGRHALAETIAHAHYLIGRGRAVRATMDDGRILFCRAEDDEGEFIAAD